MSTKEILENKINKVRDGLTTIKKSSNAVTKELNQLAEVLSKDVQNPIVNPYVDDLTKLTTRIVRESSVEIDRLCVCKEEEYDAREMISWGHLRVASLNVLTFLVCSEQRCVALLERCLDPILEVLKSKSAKTDFVGVRAAINVARNLVLPLKNRPVFWKVGALKVFLGHACHKDPNISLAAVVASRQLVLNCDKFLAQDFVSASDVKTCTELISEFLKRDLKHTHPVVRAEFSRCLALLLTSVSKVQEEKLSPFRSLLCEKASLEFLCFLLASRKPQLHAETLMALGGMRKIKSLTSDVEYVAILNDLKLQLGPSTISVKQRLDQLQGK